MPKWMVHVTRIAYSSKIIEVEANEAWAAQEIAVEKAANEEFPAAYSSEYEPGEVREVK